eukprot:4656667-Pleurochrysis_carterae.AAC.1
MSRAAKPARAHRHAAPGCAEAHTHSLSRTHTETAAVGCSSAYARLLAHPPAMRLLRAEGDASHERRGAE